MIGFLRGAIEFKANNYILIDVGGVGYKVFMPAESIKNLEQNKDIVDFKKILQKILNDTKKTYKNWSRCCCWNSRKSYRFN